MLAKLLQQTVYHHLFHYAPALQDCLEKRGLTQACLLWIKHKKVSFDWMLHLQVLSWAAAQPSPLLTPEVSRACLQAAVIRWSLAGLEHIAAQGLLVTAPSLPRLAIGVWKNQQPINHHRLVNIHLASDTLGPINYAISYEVANWQNARWFCLPKIK
jgi:hypothetical protein